MCVKLAPKKNQSLKIKSSAGVPVTWPLGVSKSKLEPYCHWPACAAQSKELTFCGKLPLGFLKMPESWNIWESPPKYSGWLFKRGYLPLTRVWKRITPKEIRVLNSRCEQVSNSTNQGEVAWPETPMWEFCNRETGEFLEKAKKKLLKFSNGYMLRVKT